jgi:hypothetical protein
VERLQENRQLLDIRLGLASNLLDTAHEIVNFDGVGAKRHSQCRLETVEVLMMVDDVFSFVTFGMLGRILKYLNTVVLKESFLRNMMEGFVKDVIVEHTVTCKIYRNNDFKPSKFSRAGHKEKYHGPVQNVKKDATRQPYEHIRLTRTII